MQSSLMKVSCGRFYTFPISCTVLFSSMKRKLISFYLVMRFKTSLIKYSSKQTIQPSMRLMGLLSIVRSSPKLYFTWTLQGVLSFQMSQLSTQLSSKMTAERQFYFQSSTASQLTPYVFEREAMKSEGNLRPISTLSLDWCIGKFLTGAETLWSNRNRYLVGRVEYILEWLNEIQMGSLVVRSQSKAQERGMRIMGFVVVKTSKSVRVSNMRKCIIIIMMGQVKRVTCMYLQLKGFVF